MYGVKSLIITFYQGSMYNSKSQQSDANLLIVFFFFSSKIS